VPRQRLSEFAEAVTTSITVLAVLFAVRLGEAVFGLALTRFGIVPRTASGLWGIVFSPLLHASWGHLLANALPLFVLLVLLLSHREYHPYRTLALVWGASGLGTWLIGRGQSVHVGASGIVFGLAAFLMVAGVRMRSARPVVVAVLVFVFFGGIFYGVLPREGPVSWEGHFCGAVAGAWTAVRTLRPVR
jgi:membrane associated rhomboid family serine protease